MSNNKPLLGALSIVGKDSLGRKLILPTSDDLIFTKPRKKTRIFERFINMFKRSKSFTKHGINKEKIKRLTVNDCKGICRKYNDKVSTIVALAQSDWRKNKRLEMGFDSWLWG